jgi:hypothetical protein
VFDASAAASATASLPALSTVARLVTTWRISNVLSEADSITTHLSGIAASLLLVRFYTSCLRSRERGGRARLQSATIITTHNDFLDARMR